MKHTKMYLYVFIVMLFVSISPHSSSAHNGKLDKLGGHFRNADCSYLLHEPTKLAKTAKTKAELLSFVKKYSNNACKNKLTTSKISLESYTLPNGRNNATTKSKIALNKKYTATLNKCVDGDTANFKINGKIYKTRFLFIDTPESTIEKEKYGKDASSYTCTKLKKAKKIVLETDGKDVYDKYDRLLAWVWVDKTLLQEQITKAGWVEDYYDYGMYKYEGRIRKAMSYAKKNHKGMY